LDLQGNKIKSVETFNVNGIEKQNVIDWTYDINSRLIKEVFDHYDDTFDQTLGFAYDFVGNRLRQTVDKGNDNVIDQAFAYFYDINDRLVEEWFDGQNDGVFEKKTNYEYDHTQQTLKSVSENGTIISETTFEYDLQGRMSVVTITTPTGVERISYEYDSNGIRVASIYEADGVITRTEYINDSQSLTGYSQVIRQTETVDGVVTKTISYVIGHQRISQIVTDKDSNQQKYYFTFDGHGSTRVLLGLTAAMTQLYSFDAYGNALGFDPAEALTEFLYSGEQFDAKIGQQYLRARYYDPATGRFNRLDPFFGNLNDPQSLHKYLYTHGNPINGIDPSGLMAMAMSIGGLGFGAGGETKYNAGVMATGTRVISTLRNVETFVNGALGSLSQVLVNAASQSQAILWCIVSNPSNAMTALKVVTAAASTVGVVVTSQMPIFWVPQLVMPNIYENTILALNHNPLWFKLSYNGGGAAAKINRTLAISGLGSAGAGWSWDEYPYASTKEGGSGAWVARVYSFENSIQGGYLSAFYTITVHHKIGESFLVVPVPSQLTYSTWKDILGF
jgi:RHS repeat-associated protein